MEKVLITFSGMAGESIISGVYCAQVKDTDTAKDISTNAEATATII
jgi:hypothetical protein